MQLILLNDINLFGTTGNLILVAVAIISLNNNIYVSSIFALVCGIISDMLFTLSIGRFMVIYFIVAIIINGIGKVYKKESNGVIIYITIISTLLFEIFMRISNLASNKGLINLFSFFSMTMKEMVLNIGLAYLVQFIAKKLKVKNKKLN